MLSDSDIRKVLSRIVAGESPIAAGTFGSYAIGRAHEGSDLDLFVIQRTAEPRIARRQRVLRHLFGLMHPADVHVFTPEEFEEDARNELSFAWVIARQAKLYRWTDEIAEKMPSLRAAIPTAGVSL